MNEHVERGRNGARRIPDATIRRLPAYLRALEEGGSERCTSQELGRRTGFSSEQVRKDLAYFGAFGTRGVGYDKKALQAEIRRILGLDMGVRAVLVGAGHLGTALANFMRRVHKDVVVVALFDSDPAKIGTRVAGIPVLGIDRLEPVVAEQVVALGIVAVPAEAAQSVADALVRGGVRGLLNFAPVTLSVASTVYVRNIDLSVELQALAYFVQAEVATEA
jgi:redox-sensing transcriptional repressor